jgi:glycosyltransferase involved in cell wall biosynthesis
MRSASEWHIGVAIPARNEEGLLARCLSSVQRAMEQVRPLATVDIVVVSDSSTDQTIQIAAQMLRGCGKAVAIGAGVVGTARATAARLLLERHKGHLSRHWMANTDADCVVPPDWLLNQLALASSGIEAIAGVVSVDDFQDFGPEMPAKFKASYLIEPGGGHPHVHGANLGVRADVYVESGGWLPLETGEDHDLWRRLAMKGVRRLSTSAITVQTSGRRSGRAPNGFAEALIIRDGTAA